MYLVQFRVVHNDALVSEWKDWDDLPGQPFLTRDYAMQAVAKHMGGGELVDVSWDRIGIFQAEYDSHYQFRFREKEISFRVGWFNGSVAETD